MYSVKEVAEILGVSVHTVRYYDDRDLIPGVIRDNTNRRQFNDDALEWIFVCVMLRKTGLSIKEIKRYVDLYQQGESTVNERYDLMLRQKNRILSELEELNLRLKLLDRKVDYYGKLVRGESATWNHDFMQNLILEVKHRNDKQKGMVGDRLLTRLGERIGQEID